MLILFSAIFITAGFALRRNWWGLTDEMSGKHVSHTPLLHEFSWSWHGARLAGSVAIGMGVFTFLGFIYLSIRGLVS